MCMRTMFSIFIHHGKGISLFLFPGCVNKVAGSTEEPVSEEEVVHLLGLLIW